MADLGGKGKRNGCLRSIQELTFCLANLPQEMKATASQRESEPADQLSPGRVHRYCHCVSAIRSAAGVDEEAGFEFRDEVRTRASSRGGSAHYRPRVNQIFSAFTESERTSSLSPQR